VQYESDFKDNELVYMRKRLIRILIATNNMKLADQILKMVDKTFSNEIDSIHTFKEIKFSPTKNMIQKGLVDIIVISEDLSDSNSEELIKFAIEINPKCSIIVFLENENSDYELHLRRKYRKNIDCVVASEWFEGFQTSLLDAYDDVMDFRSRHIVFSNQILSIDEVCYIKAEGDYLGATIYDFDKKIFHSIDRKMSMKKFMEEYNTEDDFIRCHASWIVNKRMIKKIYKTDYYLVLAVKDENGDEIQVPISSTYRKNVLAQLKGMY